MPGSLRTISEEDGICGNVIDAQIGRYSHTEENKLISLVGKACRLMKSKINYLKIRNPTSRLTKLKL